MRRIAVLVGILGSLSGALARGENVALSANGGVATESSVLTGFAGNFAAGNAIDGDTDGFRYATPGPFFQTIQHTEFEAKPWWQVTFNAVYQISTVNIFDRLDCCSDRINTFSVSLYNGATLVWFVDNQSIQNTTPNVPNWTASPDASGDRMVVALDGTNYLHMAQFQALTTPEPSGAILFLTALAMIGLLFRRRILSRG